jgi:hypothetical protein
VEVPEIDPNSYGNLECNKSGFSNYWEKDEYFNKYLWTISFPFRER